MTKNQYQCRAFSPNELVAQIGKMNLFAISGGRVQVITNEENECVEVFLPVAKGYRVAITLGFMDTWTVRREFVRGSKVFVKGVQEDVYFDQVGEVAYKASCYVNVSFAQSTAKFL